MLVYLFEEILLNVGNINCILVDFQSTHEVNLTKLLYMLEIAAKSLEFFFLIFRNFIQNRDCKTKNKVLLFLNKRKYIQSKLNQQNILIKHGNFY